MATAVAFISGCGSSGMLLNENFEAVDYLSLDGWKPRLPADQRFPVTLINGNCPSGGRRALQLRSCISGARRPVTHISKDIPRVHDGDILEFRAWCRRIQGTGSGVMELCLTDDDATTCTRESECAGATWQELIIRETVRLKPWQVVRIRLGCRSNPDSSTTFVFDRVQVQRIGNSRLARSRSR